MTKMTVFEWRECVVEFHQYGYDPYDSESVDVWWNVSTFLNREYHKDRA